jgi:hypothetical protein
LEGPTELPGSAGTRTFDVHPGSSSSGLTFPNSTDFKGRFLNPTAFRIGWTNISSAHFRKIPASLLLITSKPLKYT